MKRIAFGVFAACAASAAMSGSALAGDERACASQYALEDHLLLEWAALGGDPHAQMSIAQCAFPDGADAASMTPAERAYAVRWTTIALCDARPSDAHDRRDERLRKLKDQSSISFRRFGGLKKNEKLNWRERDFMEYRQEQTALLAERHKRLIENVSDADLGRARADLAEQLSRMGPTGLLKLAELTSCEAFGASTEFEAAAWSAVSEAWSGADVAGVYAAADSEDYDLPKIAKEKVKKLSGPERRVATIEKDRLLRTDPRRLASLEKKVSTLETNGALERLSNFTLPSSPQSSDGAGIAQAAFSGEGQLTLALQFALESLGYVNFVNGPDNDYGSTTREAVARMNARATGEPKPTVTNAEARAAICRAAAKGDPVSLYHVALMYQNGWGFPKSADKAAAAASKSETAMISALGGGGMPEWKEAAYTNYAAKIRTLAADLKTPEADQTATICD